MAIKYTKETLGINDTFGGDVNPEQASGTAIAQSVKQSSVPLENPKANLYSAIQDVGRILLDIMGVNYGERPIVVTRDGQKIIENFDFSVFKNLWLSVKCDVGPSTYWSEIAQVQMLNNLLAMKDPLFGMIDYLEALPSEYRSQELIDNIKAKQQQLMQQQQMQMQQQQAMQQQAQGQQMQQQGQEQQAKEQEYEKMADFMEKLPPQVQQKIKSLPPEQMESTIMQMMKQDINNSMKQ